MQSATVLLTVASCAGALSIAAIGCGGRVLGARECSSAPSPSICAGPVTDGGGDASSGGQPDAPAADSAAEAGLSLPAVAPAHLQLWLTADTAVDCVQGEVIAWADQSGKHRDAIRGSHKGPECPVALHALAGVNLPYFSALGALPPYNDQTLDLNLGFLAGTDYTIFVVERRWGDRTPASGKNELLIGTDVPGGSDPGCPAAGYQINLGYVYYDGFPALDYESICYRPYSGTRGRAPDVSAPLPIPAALDMLRLWQDAGASPTVWQNGVKINAGGASGGPGAGFVGGSIGRALGYTTSDNRFWGDIAEIVIFDVALTDAEAGQMNAYFRQHWRL